MIWGAFTSSDVIFQRDPTKLRPYSRDPDSWARLKPDMVKNMTDFFTEFEGHNGAPREAHPGGNKTHTVRTNTKKNKKKTEAAAPVVDHGARMFSRLALHDNAGGVALDQVNWNDIDDQDEDEDEDEDEDADGDGDSDDSEWTGDAIDSVWTSAGKGDARQRRRTAVNKQTKPSSGAGRPHDGTYRARGVVDIDEGKKNGDEKGTSIPVTTPMVLDQSMPSTGKATIADPGHSTQVRANISGRPVQNRAGGNTGASGGRKKRGGDRKKKEKKKIPLSQETIKNWPFIIIDTEEAHMYNTPNTREAALTADGHDSSFQLSDRLFQEHPAVKLYSPFRLMNIFLPLEYYSKRAANIETRRIQRVALKRQGATDPNTGERITLTYHVEFFRGYTAEDIIRMQGVSWLHCLNPHRRLATWWRKGWMVRDFVSYANFARLWHHDVFSFNNANGFFVDTRHTGVDWRDPGQRQRWLIDLIMSNSLKWAIPGSLLSLDEIILFSCHHSSLRVVMPCKPDGVGHKLWALACSKTGLVLSSIVSCRKTDRMSWGNTH